MAMVIGGNIVDAHVVEGISQKTGNAYRMVTAKILTDFGLSENPKKDLVDVQMDSEFPDDAIQKFMEAINRDQFQKVEVRVTNMSSRVFGNSAQTALSVEFLKPAIKIPEKEKAAAQNAQNAVESPEKPSGKSESK